MCAVLHSLPAQDLRVIVTVDGHQVTVGAHGIERYWERVKPTLPSAQAAAEDLERAIVACGRIHDQAPAWKGQVHTPSKHERAAVAWLWLGADIALPLTACLYRAGDFFSPTCLAKGSCGDELRARRAERRRNATQAKARRRAATRRSAAHSAPRRVARTVPPDYDQYDAFEEAA
jgi:hypothetical protein